MKKTIDFSKYSSIKCGPVLEVFHITDETDIPEDHTIIGAANNLLVAPEAKNLMKLSKNFDYIKEDDRTLTIGAATPSGKIVSYCKKHDLGGFEFLASLPGCLGGLLKMNAGLKGWEIFDRLLWLRTRHGCVEKEKIPHTYRNAELGGIVFEAVFRKEKGFDTTIVEKLRRLRSNQPKEPSAGSCFKNPAGDYAGRLIEAVGLKGYRRGGFAFSDKHANFLINAGEGSFADALWLIEEAKRRVAERFGIELVEEIRIIR